MAAAPISWTCPTCKKTVLTPFCPQCGERPLQPVDLTLRSLLGKLLHALTSIDSRLLRTSMPYIAPLQLFLAANVLFFAVQSMTQLNIFGASLDSQLHQQDWSELARELVAQRLAKTQTPLEAYAPVFDRAVVLNAKSLIILMVLPFAVLLSVACLARRKAFIVHAVFAFHLYTFLLLLFSLAIAAAALSVLFGGPGLEAPRMDNLLTAIILFACAAYLYAAMGPVYDARGPWRFAGAVALTAGAGAVVLAYRFALFLITLYAT